jgi:hypothetical protein
MVVSTTPARSSTSASAPSGALTSRPAMALTAITRSISACPTGAGGKRDIATPESGREVA